MSYSSHLSSDDIKFLVQEGLSKLEGALSADATIYSKEIQLTLHEASRYYQHEVIKQHKTLNL